ncbi:hypothetical protein K504DRAFT_528998 [Pleomassaria siparia CBS 279.74]|uniref:Lytic polysaccharide monooxygenase n=1 Tax=Pleomassaria siparia CBS 279.74 TaxID=1314801 RepID=A0A6G1KPF0_9PLEO|nr:hypothetical protein K504DRAFT_528998 [Pleomassaria siparia CBS 279.74]
MAPLSLFAIAAILAFSGVDAARNKVRLYQFTNLECQGHPVGKQSELVMGKCRKIGALSVMVQHPKKDKNAKWMGDVNNGKHECFVSLYSGPGCLDDAVSWTDKTRLGYAVRTLPVPGEFEHCSPLRESKEPEDFYGSIRSAKFHCEKPGHLGKVVDATKTIHVTSYSFDDYKTPHPYTYTSTVTAPVWSYPDTGSRPSLEPRGDVLSSWKSKASSVVADLTSQVPDAVSSATSFLNHRKPHYNRKAVWLKHPWTGGEECFECWTTGHSIRDSFKCESGPNTNVDCGKVPERDLANPEYWTTDSATSTTTASLEVNNTTMLHPPTPLPAPGLQERSEKKIVRLQNPFDHYGTQVCAKAKWKHAGKRNQRVEIKGPKKCNKQGSKNWPVDVKYTTTVYSTSTSMIVPGPTHTPAAQVVINPTIVQTEIQTNPITSTVTLTVEHTDISFRYITTTHVIDVTHTTASTLN